MKYQVGDKIIVLYSEEEGTVIDIINDKMVMIEVKGVKFPAYMDQIDFPYFKQFTQKKNPDKQKIYVDQIRKEKQTTKQKTGQGVYLNFIPVFVHDVFDDEVVDRLKVFLVNQDDVSYNFQYELSFTGETRFQLKNNLPPLSDFYVHDISFEEMNDAPRFAVEFSLEPPDKKKAPYFETSLKIKAKQLFKKIEEIQLNNQPSFSYLLFDQYPDKTAEEKVDLSKLGNAGYRIYNTDAIKAGKHMPPARSVIDLHIEKLTDHWQEMDPAEILALQLQAFENSIELAIAHNLKYFTVVHGIGEGTLREEIHHRLKLKPEVKSFVNQLHPLFGYGATEIFLKD